MFFLHCNNIVCPDGSDSFLIYTDFRPRKHLPSELKPLYIYMYKSTYSWWWPYNWCRLVSISVVHPHKSLWALPCYQITKEILIIQYPFLFQLRVWAQPKKINQTEYALQIGEEIYEYFTDYFGINDIVPKSGAIYKN